LTLDDDVAALLAELQKRRAISFREAANEALRAGLQRLDMRPRRGRGYRMKPVSLGRCLLPNLDDVAEVLALVEGASRGIRGVRPRR
jgi:hypothetical protein